ncbi:MAG: formyltetrahydrofolate deformylase [Alphaproteobacteria bacterium]|nr:formyltetrahydrofolate deformylase [Alphaproteobacteria bacterium]
MSKSQGAAPQRYILTISCPDAVGIVASVAGFLSGFGAFIEESSHFGDPVTQRFFMRTVFQDHPDLPPIEKIEADFASQVGSRFGMEWRIFEAGYKPRVLLLVSKFDHCLNDLLYRYRTGQLKMDIPAVVSNHRDLERLVEWHGIPYHHLPVDAASKPAQEAQILEMVDRMQIDLVVLARYMQVLSENMCKSLSGRCINIHHSFLPSFKGARPYHQAHARGVKIIGATAHYVTTDLDEGPIIEQEVERVDHAMTPDTLAAIGRDIESRVLARAVGYHIEHRVLMNGVKTVIFK